MSFFIESSVIYDINICIPTFFTSVSYNKCFIVFSSASKNKPNPTMKVKSNYVQI